MINSKIEQSLLNASQKRVCTNRKKCLHEGLPSTLLVTKNFIYCPPAPPPQFTASEKNELRTCVPNTCPITSSPVPTPLPTCSQMVSSLPWKGEEVILNPLGYDLPHVPLLGSVARSKAFFKTSCKRVLWRMQFTPGCYTWSWPAWPQCFGEWEGTPWACHHLTSAPPRKMTQAGASHLGELWAALDTHRCQKPLEQVKQKNLPSSGA